MIKKIVIVDNHVPFIWGGAEYHIQNLNRAFKEAGYQSEVVRVPFKWYPYTIIPKYILISRLIDLTESAGESIDLLVGFRFPSYFIPHPNKVLWLMHPYKAAYELWKTEFSDIPPIPEGEKIRESIINADKKYLKEAKRLFSISKTVSSRFKKFLNIDSKPLYHPPPGIGKYRCEDYENFIYYPSRMTLYKRQHLAVEAMKFVKSDVKLVLVGKADDPHYQRKVEETIEKNNLQDKVILKGELPTHEEVIELYSKCLAVLFPTYQEDYGYITLEAMYSQKAVITCTDSGGPTEFVEDGVNGFVVEPEPRKIAQRIDELAQNREKAIKMGRSAYEKIISMDITWQEVVEELTK